MLPFTRARMENAPHIFYYDRYSRLPFVAEFSQWVFDDLKNNLGIEREIREHVIMSNYLNETLEDAPGSQQKYYDARKIGRIESLYEFYLDSILETMQIDYYTVLNKRLIYNHCKKYDDVYDTAMIALANGGAVFPDIDAIRAVNKASVDEIARFISTVSTYSEKSGIQLSKCYEMARTKCEPLYKMVKEMIGKEYPTQTFADKHTRTAKRLK